MNPKLVHDAFLVNDDKDVEISSENTWRLLETQEPNFKKLSDFNILIDLKDFISFKSVEDALKSGCGVFTEIPHRAADLAARFPLPQFVPPLYSREWLTAHNLGWVNVGSYEKMTMETNYMQTIALVDDDRNILTSVSIALEAEGYRVETYTDGASALDRLIARPPQLAIFDIKMPRMDGMELCGVFARNRIFPLSS